MVDFPSIATSTAENYKRLLDSFKKYGSKASYLVRAHFEKGRNHQDLWVDVESIGGSHLVGKIAKPIFDCPITLKNIRPGDKVRFSKDKVNDWDVSIFYSS